MRGESDGFTLIEVAIALVILAVGLIATAPLFVYAAKENAGGGDMGTVGVLAVRQTERLRGSSFSSLANGGSLDADVSGYSDLSDPDFSVRWTISDGASPAGIKVVVVRATANHAVFGQPKSTTLVTLRGE